MTEDLRMGKDVIEELFHCDNCEKLQAENKKLREQIKELENEYLPDSYIEENERLREALEHITLLESSGYGEEGDLVVEDAVETAKQALSGKGG